MNWLLCVCNSFLKRKELWACLPGSACQLQTTDSTTPCCPASLETMQGPRAWRGTIWSAWDTWPNGAFRKEPFTRSSSYFGLFEQGKHRAILQFTINIPNNVRPCLASVSLLSHYHYQPRWGCVGFTKSPHLIYLSLTVATIKKHLRAWKFCSTYFLSVHFYGSL